MKKLLFVLFLLAMAYSAHSADVVVVRDTVTKQLKNSSMTVTNVGVITSANAVTSGAVQGVNTSAGAGDAGKVIKLDASGLIATNMLPAVATSSDFSRMAVYSTSQSWTNSFGVTRVLIELWGGGGAGGSGGGANTGGCGGGGGAYIRSIQTVTNNQICAFTVGGNTSWGSLSANAGSAGANGMVSGAGGTTSGTGANDETVGGQAGGAAGTVIVGAGGSAGKGGGGGLPAISNAGGNPGGPGADPGGGGGGGAGNGFGAGGAGGTGRVIIWY